MSAHGTASFIPFNAPRLLADGASLRSEVGGTPVPAILESTSVAVGKVSTQIWKGTTINNSWTQVTIVNDGPEPVYLNVNGGAAVVGQGIRLNPEGGTYTQNNQHYEPINGIVSRNENNVTLTVA
jgi:hypothetical protein